MAFGVDFSRQRLLCCGRGMSPFSSKLLVNWLFCYAYFSRLLQTLKKNLFHWYSRRQINAAGQCPRTAFSEGDAPLIRSDNSSAAANDNGLASTVVNEPAAPSKARLLFDFCEGDLWRIFKGLDGDGDGMVSGRDIRRLLQNLGLHNNNNIISQDDDGDEDEKYFINFDGFCSLCLPLFAHCEDQPEEVLMEAFCVFDKNGDGFITQPDLQQLLLSLRFNEAHDSEFCKNMIKVFDINCDGRIDFMEFHQMMTATKKTP